uniref:hypothetical protein n=1 Tax=Paractinoplanes polyasparticus TaxID=2856853 RepID=UPI001C84A1D4|nr:hypothetical protein [Actinoplanes polyasparticus]
MGTLQRAPGRKVTRRLEDPKSFVMGGVRAERPSNVAYLLADRHNDAVRAYGSNSGGYHCFDPASGDTAAVVDGGPFPDGSVVSRLSWGVIDGQTAQRLLEIDGVVS